MDAAGQRAAEWARDTLAQRGGDLSAIAALKGDASTRRFWRIVIKGSLSQTPAGFSPPTPASAIVIDLGPDDLPAYARELNLYPVPLTEPPWISMHRFLSALGARVPALYAWSHRERMLLVEDVGSLSLHDAARADRSRTADLYRDAVGELMRLHADGSARRDPQCIAFAVNYEEHLFSWEMRRFAEIGLQSVAPGSDAAALEPELERLARELGRLPRVLSHRDFHAGNLFVQDADRIRIIDFQDALMAPAAQDLAVLITTRDTSELIGPELEARLLDFYFTGMLRRKAASLGHDEFRRSYDLCVLQHALKCIGLFVYLEHQGKRGYRGYIPFAVAQTRRMLERTGVEFPHLRSIFAP